MDREQRIELLESEKKTLEHQLATQRFSIQSNLVHRTANQLVFLFFLLSACVFALSCFILRWSEQRDMQPPEWLMRWAYGNDEEFNKLLLMS